MYLFHNINKYFIFTLQNKNFGSTTLFRQSSANVTSHLNLHFGKNPMLEYTKACELTAVL